MLLINVCLQQWSWYVLEILYFEHYRQNTCTAADPSVYKQSSFIFGKLEYTGDIRESWKWKTIKFEHITVLIKLVYSKYEGVLRISCGDLWWCQDAQEIYIKNGD